MVRKISKGCTVPYNGFLLNMGEYEEYRKYLDILPDLLRVVKEGESGEEL